VTEVLSGSSVQSAGFNSISLHWLLTTYTNI